MAGAIGRELKLLGKHSAVYGLAQVLNRAVSIIMLPVYTRFLSPSDYGILDIVYFSVALAGIVLELGLLQAMGRLYFDTPDQAERDRVVSVTLISFAVVIVIFAVPAVLASEWIARLVFQGDGYGELMAIALAGLAAQMITSSGYAYLRIRQRSGRLLGLSSVLLASQVALNLLFLVGMGLGVAGILWSTLITNALLAAGLIPSILRETGHHFSWKTLKQLTVFGLPLLPARIVEWVVNVSDRFFLVSFHGLAVTGIYTLGYRIGTLIWEFAALPFSQIWLARRYEAYEQDDAPQLFGRIFAFFVAAVAFAGLGISALAEDIIRLLCPPAFHDAGAVVPLIVLAYVVGSFCLHFDFGMLMRKKTTRLMGVQLATGTVTLALNAMLIPTHGVWGAGWATLASLTFKATLMYIMSRRLAPIVVNWPRTVQALALAIFLYGVLRTIDIAHPVASVLLKGAGCCLHPAILVATGYFEPSERASARAKAESVLRAWIQGRRGTERDGRN